MAKRKQFDRLELIDRERMEYNAKHKTHYTYGQYTAMIRMKLIKPKRGPEWWSAKVAQCSS